MRLPSLALLAVTLSAGPSLVAQSATQCSELSGLKIAGVEITSTRFQSAVDKAPAANPWDYSGPLPEHCRVEGVIDRRTGAGGEEFGIRFAIAMPTDWNGDYLQQGGGGGNGTVALPVGPTAAGTKPALLRGFAVASTDTGHKAHSGPFDFAFMRDQQAMLDFAFEANVRVASAAREILAAYYRKPAAFSYFAGCSTGGREGMILSQRFPDAFNGIISGDPAMRTGLSNIAIGPWSESAWNRIAPKDANGKAQLALALTDADRKLVMDALLARCDAKDGIADGMISNPLACDFSPEQIACKQGQTSGCLAPEKAAAIAHVFSGPKTSRGFQVYPGFLYDTGIAERGFAHGLLVPGPGPVLAPFSGTEFDVDEAIRTASDPLVEPLSTNLSTFAAHKGKLIFFHGDSDPWFSPLDTLEYYQSLAAANGGADRVAGFSQIYLVPGMGHCGGGPALDQFDLLTPLVDWVEKGEAPHSVTATGRAFPGRSRPLCPFPQHAQFNGSGNPEEAASFTCQQ